MINKLLETIKWLTKKHTYHKAYKFDELLSKFIIFALLSLDV